MIRKLVDWYYHKSAYLGVIDPTVKYLQISANNINENFISKQSIWKLLKTADCTYELLKIFILII